LTLIADAYSSRSRAVLAGLNGAVSAAHPLAVAAGQEMLLTGGSAADAAIAAQAVLCVLSPEACGLGGDMLALVHRPGQDPVAVNAAGAAPAALPRTAQPGGAGDGPNSMTVPGIVDGWVRMAERWGRLTLARSLEPAVRIARSGRPVSRRLAAALTAQRGRLLRGGAAQWSLIGLNAGDRFVQPDLASLLEAIGREGAAAFYQGPAARMICDAVQSLGGTLSLDDLAAHRTEIRAPITTRVGDATVAVQPPMTQGVLLAMALAGRDRLGASPDGLSDHIGVELTEAAFAYRARAGEGEALLGLDLPVDFDRAQNRGGPRAYLHTAGVATADGDGMTVSTLVSVFDDFGSCVFVPGCGITLNNRCDGFTEAPNDAAPGKRPVHTLAPALAIMTNGALALATPGADGQVQTLLQVIAAALKDGVDLATAIAKPRWRSEGGALLIERSHPEIDRLQSLGHRIKVLADGDTRFGAVVCAGQFDGAPITASDWRRETWSGVV
jgi:gamma-glutamyltranspeptidase/glutathione hydrolase